MEKDIETITSENVKNDNRKSENITSDDVKTLSSREKSNANLVPFTSEQSQEQAKINGAKGGIKSGETRRARKTAQELLTKILTTNLTDEQIDECLGTASALLNGDKTSYNVMLVKALTMAIQGDSKALSFVRDTVGDMPITKQEVNATLDSNQKAIIDSVASRLLG